MKRRLEHWEIVASAYVIDSQHFRLRRDVVRLGNGRLIEDYYVRDTHGFCVVLALTPDRRVVLVRQYKHGAGAVLVELPAGAVEPGEDPAACAARELAEETGYAGDAPIHVRTLFGDPTNSTGRAHVYLIRNACPTGSQALDPTEEIDVETVTLAAFTALLRSGGLASTAQVAAAYLALEHLGALDGAS